MEKKEMLYEGKAKKVFATEDPALCVVKDMAGLDRVVCARKHEY